MTFKLFAIPLPQPALPQPPTFWITAVCHHSGHYFILFSFHFAVLCIISEISPLETMLWSAVVDMLLFFQELFCGSCQLPGRIPPRSPQAHSTDLGQTQDLTVMTQAEPALPWLGVGLRMQSQCDVVTLCPLARVLRHSHCVLKGFSSQSAYRWPAETVPPSLESLSMTPKGSRVEPGDRNNRKQKQTSCPLNSAAGSSAPGLSVWWTSPSWPRQHITELECAHTETHADLARF